MMISFDFGAIVFNAVVSAVILFFIGLFLGRNVKKVVSFIKNCFIFIVPILVFWLSHRTPDFQAIIDLGYFLPVYLISCLTSLFGMAIGDYVNSVLENVRQSSYY